MIEGGNGTLNETVEKRDAHRQSPKPDGVMSWRVAHVLVQTAQKRIREILRKVHDGRACFDDDLLEFVNPAQSLGILCRLTASRFPPQAPSCASPAEARPTR